MLVWHASVFKCDLWVEHLVWDWHDWLLFSEILKCILMTVLSVDTVFDKSLSQTKIIIAKCETGCCGANWEWLMSSTELWQWVTAALERKGHMNEPGWFLTTKSLTLTSAPLRVQLWAERESFHDFFYKKKTISGLYSGKLLRSDRKCDCRARVLNFYHEFAQKV